MVRPYRAVERMAYTPELASEICDRLAKGESLISICRDEDKPNASTVYDWLALHEDFADKYARARETQAEVMAQEILEIADDGTNDWMERRSEAEKGAGIATGWVINGEHVQRSRLRVDARKWLASKLAPKKYGEKLELAGDAANPIKHDVEMRLPPLLTREEWLKLHKK